MSKPTLSYFDAPVSRGEECRLALHAAGVDFIDDRIKRADWPARKLQTPFGSVPVLEWPGHGTIAHSNAILVLIGRKYGLHPKDDFEAARHEAVMEHVEDLRHTLTPTMRMSDEAQKKAARQELAAGYLPTWAANTEKQLGDGPFFGGASLSVVDLKLYITIRWLRSGALDHIPSTIFDAYPKLLRVHDAVQADARIQSWQSRG